MVLQDRRRSGQRDLTAGIVAVCSLHTPGVMDAALLQDSLTINGGGGIPSIIQSAHQYLDIGRNEDLVFYLDVKNVSNVSGPVTISYETSPTPQDSSFLAMIAPITISTPGLRVDRAAFSTAAVPPARYVRWRLSSAGTSNWGATFRIWVAAYSYC